MGKYSSLRPSDKAPQAVTEEAVETWINQAPAEKDAKKIEQTKKLKEAKDAKILKGIWLAPETEMDLRRLSAELRRSQASLVEEALAILFKKYFK
jgi:hypothetical protein